MNLRVNGQDVDVTLEDEKTIGDVLKAFETEAAANEATTISIALDGKKIGAQDFASILDAPIEDNTLLELEVVSKADVKADLLTCAESFSAVGEELTQIPMLLQSGKDSQASGIITKLADAIDAFCHTATMCALFPDLYKSVSVDGMEINTFFQDMPPILADLEQALADKDTVTVGDLTEYEIGPRLEKLTHAVNVIKS